MILLQILPFIGRGSSVGSVSALEAGGPKIDPRILHILRGKTFHVPLIQEEKLLAKERAIHTGKLPTGGLPRNSVVT